MRATISRPLSTMLPILGGLAISEKSIIVFTESAHRPILSISRYVCLCHQSGPGTKWTGDFWSKSVRYKCKTKPLFVGGGGDLNSFIWFSQSFSLLCVIASGSLNKNAVLTNIA